ncbi:nuclear transport factor 2 family protein [Hyphococcus sp.]|uniref:nuclear transport factor 2 family protein n=1 Tax=Hyphococcus sp. TaxID=2038636 RepID=UPI003CCBE56F
MNDFLAIERVVFDYCWFADMQDIDALVSLFDQDGIMDASEFGLPVIKGRQSLRDFFQTLLETHKCSQHLAGNFRVDIAKNEASGTSYYVMEGLLKDSSPISAKGYYKDRFVRTTEGWKILRRKGIPLLPVNSYTVKMDSE